MITSCSFTLGVKFVPAAPIVRAEAPAVPAFPITSLPPFKDTAVDAPFASE